MKISAPLALAAALVLGHGQASYASTTFFSDLGKSSDNTGVAAYYNATDVFASDFLTSSSATTITDGSFSFVNSDVVDHSITPSIYTDNNGKPGTLVGSLSAFTAPAQGFSYSNFSSTSAGIDLAAGTKYWMVLSVDSGAFSALHWNTTASTAVDFGSTFSEVLATDLKYSANGGSTWTNATTSTANGMFSLSGSISGAPEPARGMLLLAGACLLALRRRRC